MIVHILGSASGAAALHRCHAAVMVEGSEDCVLLDAGEGVSRAFLRDGVSWDLPAAVYISHTHADHVAGLPMLLQSMHLGRRTRPLHLHVPPGREQWFRDWLHGQYVFAEKWHFPLHITTLHAPREGGTVSVEAIENTHLQKVRALAARYNVTAQSYSFVVTHGGVRAAVSSDVAGADDLKPLLPASRVLITDAAHVGVEELVELRAAWPGLDVIATHIPAELDLRLAGGDAGITEQTTGLRFAVDGMRIQVGEVLRYE